MTRPIPSARTHGRRRPATLYIAVLGISLLVTVIGLSGLLLARVEQQSATDAYDAARADVCAQSGIDLALFLIGQQTNWRTYCANDTWTAAIQLDDVECRFKLVDEQDGDITNDREQPVRLYAKATCRQATRIYSVLLRPNVTPNLLSNPGFENGLTDWTSLQCDLDLLTVNPHDGGAYVRADERSGEYAGPRQYIQDVIDNGMTYRLEGWVRLKSGQDNFKITIFTNGSGSGDRWFNFTSPTAQANWTKISGTVTPTWSGTLNTAYYYVETASTTTDIYADDLVMVEDNPYPPVFVVPGTWRREVEN